MSLTPELKASIAAQMALATAFTTTKLGLTGLLTDFVNKFNANAPKAEQNAALTAYVLQFNKMTAASDALRNGIAKLIADGAAAELVLYLRPVMQNLTQEQSDTLAADPWGYYGTASAIIFNLITASQESEEKCVEVVNMLHKDLLDNVVLAYHPEVPTPAGDLIEMKSLSLDHLDDALLVFHNAWLAAKGLPPVTHETVNVTIQ